MHRDFLSSWDNGGGSGSLGSRELILTWCQKWQRDTPWRASERRNMTRISCAQRDYGRLAKTCSCGHPHMCVMPDMQNTSFTAPWQTSSTFIEGWKTHSRRELPLWGLSFLIFLCFLLQFGPFSPTASFVVPNIFYSFTLGSIFFSSSFRKANTFRSIFSHPECTGKNPSVTSSHSSPTEACEGQWMHWSMNSWPLLNGVKGNSLNATNSQSHRELSRSLFDLGLCWFLPLSMKANLQLSIYHNEKLYLSPRQTLKHRHHYSREAAAASNDW